MFMNPSTLVLMGAVVLTETAGRIPRAGSLLPQPVHVNWQAALFVSPSASVLMGVVGLQRHRRWVQGQRAGQVRCPGGPGRGAHRPG